MSYTYEITTAGKALIAKAQTGTRINFSKAILGSGDLAIDESPADFTDLKVPEETSVEILYKDYLPETGNARITLSYSNEGLVNGYYVKEVGLFADDPDEGEILFLYCYSSDADYLPPDSLDPIFVEPIINLIINIDNVSEITANILPESNVVRADYTENSILTADVINNPTALTVEENRIIGRKTGGNISDLTASEVREMLNVSESFPTGTVMLFGQAAAPIGWTKKTDWNDNAMLTLNSEVNGTALQSGGSANPQYAHNHSTGSMSLSISQLALHGHPYRVENNDAEYSFDGGFNTGIDTGSVQASFPSWTGSAQGVAGRQIGGEGSSETHNHGAVVENDQPLFQEIIACTKN